MVTTPRSASDPSAPCETLKYDVRLKAAIFDTDGVITRTASVHFAAWKQVFDEVLGSIDGDGFVPFTDDDYRRHVDGIDRYDGVANFLVSRGIHLLRGSAEDPPGHDTVCAVGNLKNVAFLEQVREHGVEPYPGTVRLLHSLRANGVATAAISASRNCAEVLDAADVSGLFDARVDGVDASEMSLAGKPEPDVFLEAARRLGVEPSEAAMVEDAVAGVEAGRRGEFAMIIGVDRTRHPAELERFADVVVPDLADLECTERTLVRSIEPGMPLPWLPFALDDTEVPRQVGGRQIAVFLDYDGTLTPIVDRPEHAVLSAANRRALTDLAAVVPVGIISGRDLEDVRAMVGVDGLWYAGSHGFDVLSPQGQRRRFDEGGAAEADFGGAEADLRSAVSEIDGVWVERKKFAIAIHFRAADPADEGRLERSVRKVAESNPGLRMTGGKKIFELRPDVDWDKGRALEWMLATTTGEDSTVLPVYVGDDETDEDAFRVIRGSGLAVVVGDEDRHTAAHCRLDDPDQLGEFLTRLVRLVGADG